MCRGVSLVELVVALVILELAVLGALGGAVHAELVRRRAADGARADAARWEAWHGASRAPSCLASGAPAARALTLPATAGRAPLPAVIGCGR